MAELRRRRLGAAWTLFCVDVWTRFLDVRQKRFLAYLGIQAFVTVAVIFIFRFSGDIKMASLLAGGLFVVVPLAIAWAEYKRRGFERKSLFVGLLQFWLLFALPIFWMRLSNWEVPFNELSFLGIPGADMHRWSSSSYTVMMAMTFWNYLKRD